MFDNEFTEDSRPICPLCKEVIPERESPESPAPAELVTTPKGLYFMHTKCVTDWNERATLLRSMGFTPKD